MNVERSKCSLCHQVPTKPLQKQKKEGATADEKPVTHQSLEEAKVRCEGCHLQLVQGKGPVKRERCITCHDNAEQIGKDLFNFKLMHEKHVADQKAHCGKPIASFQMTQEKLVWMATEITKEQLLVLQLGRLKDAGRIRFQQISMAKRNGCRTARRAAHLAREILGGVGIMHDYPIARHFCNIEAVYTYEGTDDIHTLILGERITGLSAF